MAETHGQWICNSLAAYYFGEIDPKCWRLIDGSDADLFRSLTISKDDNETDGWDQRQSEHGFDA